MSFIWNFMEILGIISGIKLMVDTSKKLYWRLCRDIPIDHDNEMGMGTLRGYNRRNRERENWVNSFQEDRKYN